MMTRGWLLAGAVLVFGTVNWQIAGKERLRETGQVVYLQLAPIDPRSIMQGDYMALNFAVARAIGSPEGLAAAANLPGIAVLQIDARRVGTYRRLDSGAPLAADEVRLRFRIREESVWLGSNAFFFHEGDAERFRNARYGEFRVNEDGEAMLVGLRDPELRRL